MQANNPKTHLTWQEHRSKVCLQFVFFFVACVTTQNQWVHLAHPFFCYARRIWFLLVWKAIQVRLHRCKHKEFDWGGVGCGKPETSKTAGLSCLHPTSRLKLHHATCKFEGVHIMDCHTFFSLFHTGTAQRFKLIWTIVHGLLSLNLSWQKKRQRYINIKKIYLIQNLY